LSVVTGVEVEVTAIVDKALVKGRRDDVEPASGGRE